MYAYDHNPVRGVDMNNPGRCSKYSSGVKSPATRKSSRGVLIVHQNMWVEFFNLQTETYLVGVCYSDRIILYLVGVCNSDQIINRSFHLLFFTPAVWLSPFYLVGVCTSDRMINRSLQLLFFTPGVGS